jgi:hypothetical protein
MKNIIYTLLALVIISGAESCKSKKKSAKNDNMTSEQEQVDKNFDALNNDNTDQAKYTTSDSIMVIGLERTACFGRCPIYKVKIYDTGFITYEGINFVDNIGFYKSIVSQDIISSILLEANQINFFDLEDEYDGPVTDLPSTIITISSKGQTKRIKARYMAPQELVALGRYIDSQLTDVSWGEHRE